MQDLQRSAANDRNALRARVIIAAGSGAVEQLTYAVPPALAGRLCAGHRVLVPMRTRPVFARRKAVPDGNPWHDGTGLVFQAEEVRESGKPRRYYGFVGAGLVARIPAEELEIYPESLQTVIQRFP